MNKGDLGEIEPEAVVCNYDGQTFFSLFEEQDVVYQTLFEQLDVKETESERSLIREDRNGGLSQYLNHLCYVIEMPITLSVKENDDLTDLSIIKQSLLFNNTEALIMMYKLAKLVPQIDFEDYISSQEDLEVIIERLPAQQYLAIFKMFG